MNTTQLEYFVVLSDTLNYSKAADILNIAQPTLSKAIKHLEKEIGFELFTKKGRNIVLTQQASTFLPYIKKALSSLNKGLDLAYSEKESLRLGAVLTAVNHLSRFVELLHSQFPNTFVKITNGVSVDLIKQLLNHELDFIFCTPSDKYPEIAFIPFFEQKVFICVYKNHPYFNLDKIEIEMLQDVPFVTHTPNSSVYNLFKEIVNEKGIDVKPVASADEDSQLIALVKNKMGLAMIATSIPTNTDEIHYIPLVQNRIHRIVSIGYLKEDIETNHILNILINIQKQVL